MYFTVIRTLSKLKRVAQYKLRARKIGEYCREFDEQRLQRVYLERLKEFCSSDEIFSKKKARTYRRSQLLAPAFVSMKRNMFLKASQKEIARANECSQVRVLFKHWIGLSQQNKMNIKST